MILLHALLVPIIFCKYLLQQVHDELGHTGTARIYQYLKPFYFSKGMNKDVDNHVKQ